MDTFEKVGIAIKNRIDELRRFEDCIAEHGTFKKYANKCDALQVQCRTHSHTKHQK